jgi:hypothetical protein
LLQALPSGDEELYTRFKKLEAHREFLNLQEASDTALPNDRGYVLTSIVVLDRYMDTDFHPNLDLTGIHPLRNPQPPPRTPPCSRRSQTDQIRPSRHRPVPRSDRRCPRHRRLDDGFQLCRQDPLYSRQGTFETFLFGSSA